MHPSSVCSRRVRPMLTPQTAFPMQSLAPAKGVVPFGAAGFCLGPPPQSEMERSLVSLKRHGKSDCDTSTRCHLTSVAPDGTTDRRGDRSDKSLRKDCDAFVEGIAPAASPPEGFVTTLLRNASNSTFGSSPWEMLLFQRTAGDEDTFATPLEDIGEIQPNFHGLTATWDRVHEHARIIERKTRNAEEGSLLQAVEELCVRMALPGSVAQTAHHCSLDLLAARKARKCRPLRLPIIAVAAACVYATCDAVGAHRTVKDTLRISGCNTKDLTAALAHLRKLLQSAGKQPRKQSALSAQHLSPSAGVGASEPQLQTGSNNTSVFDEGDLLHVPGSEESFGFDELAGSSFFDRDQWQWQAGPCDSDAGSGWLIPQDELEEPADLMPVATPVSPPSEAETLWPAEHPNAGPDTEWLFAGSVDDTSGLEPSVWAAEEAALDNEETSGFAEEDAEMAEAVHDEEPSVAAEEVAVGDDEAAPRKEDIERRLAAGVGVSISINDNAFRRMLAVLVLLREAEGAGEVRVERSEDEDDGANCALGFRVIHVHRIGAFNRRVRRMIDDDRDGVWRKVNGKAGAPLKLPTAPLYEVFRKLGVRPGGRTEEGRREGEEDRFWRGEWAYQPGRLTAKTAERMHKGHEYSPTAPSAVRKRAGKARGSSR